jgi:hypothetical protein
MKEIFKYLCPACNLESEYPAQHNKHIKTCKVYNEWIKTYTPPKTTKCDNCLKEFININNHECV